MLRKEKIKNFTKYLLKNSKSESPFQIGNYLKILIYPPKRID